MLADLEAVKEDVVPPVPMLTLRLLLWFFGDRPVLFALCLHSGFLEAPDRPGLRFMPTRSLEVAEINRNGVSP